MKVAAIGTGMIAEEFLRVQQYIPEIEVTALCSTERSHEKGLALQSKYKIHDLYSDYQLCLENESVDTVYIATPNHLHYEQALNALLKGKNVICEKPFALHSEELDILSNLADKSKLILVEAITNQYLENYGVIKDNLSEIGEIRVVELNYSQYSSRYDKFREGGISPVFDPDKGGGALRDLNVYNIHLAVGLFGKPRDVNYFGNIKSGIDTSGILVLDYSTFHVVCVAAKDSVGNNISTIQGDDGTIFIKGATNILPSIVIEKKGQKRKKYDENDFFHRMYNEFIEFSKMIEYKDFSYRDVKLEQSKAVLEVIDQALKTQPKSYV